MTSQLFTDDMRVHVGFMDEDHQHLCEVLEALMDGIRDGHEEEQIRKTVADLVVYAQQHFAREEEKMRETSYPDIEQHQHQHAEFFQTVGEFNTRSKIEDGQLVADMVQFMTRWLINHIKQTDQMLGAWLLKSGVS